jgi:hypothetical protein
MKVEVRMAIISHLSDAQELIDIGIKDKASEQINYAKRMLNYYGDNVTQRVDEKELTEVCLGEKKRPI